MEPKSFEERRQEAWRNSDFYDWIHKVIDEEISRNYLKEAMELRYASQEPMSNDEIGEAAKVDFQVSARLRSVKETLQ